MAINETLKQVLDGDGYASPLGVRAREFGLGTVIDGIHTRLGDLDGGSDTGVIVANTITEETAGTGVTVDGCLIKDGRAAALATAAMFLSGEVTGTGSAQNTAHGLGVVPTICLAFPIEASGAYDIAAGTHTTTNAVFTVSSGVKYRVLAIL